MSIYNAKQTINCKGNLLNLSQPKVMGIINITPDSFYKESRCHSVNQIIKQVDNMINQGVDVIDLGAYSSRPNADNVSETEEWQRLKDPLMEIRDKFPEIIISVDTFRSDIAAKCVQQFNVNIINDISGGELDSDMFNVIGELNVPYVLMHMRGNPQNMQQNTNYKFIVQEMITYFSQKLNSLYKAGVKDVIIDPGFGFSKTLDQNYEVLARLNEFKMLELPILVGLSRKSMIYNALNITPDQALNGTTVLNSMALTRGANILRVHDVVEAIQTIKLHALITKSLN